MQTLAEEAGDEGGAASLIQTEASSRLPGRVDTDVVTRARPRVGGPPPVQIMVVRRGATNPMVTGGGPCPPNAARACRDMRITASEGHGERGTSTMGDTETDPCTVAVGMVTGGPRHEVVRPIIVSEGGTTPC